MAILVEEADALVVLIAHRAPLPTATFVPIVVDAFARWASLVAPPPALLVTVTGEPAAVARLAAPAHLVAEAYLIVAPAIALGEAAVVVARLSHDPRSFVLEAPFVMACAAAVVAAGATTFVAAGAKPVAVIVIADEVLA